MSVPIEPRTCDMSLKPSKASIIAICEELVDAKGQIPISRLADAMRLLGMNPTDQDAARPVFP